MTHDSPKRTARLANFDEPSAQYVVASGKNAPYENHATATTGFAKVDKPAEGSGIYFGKEPHTLYVNVQHSGTGNDKTMAITQQRKGHHTHHYD